MLRLSFWEPMPSQLLSRARVTFLIILSLMHWTDLAGAGQLFGANANTWKIGAGICLAGMLAEFISFSAFSVAAIHFGYRYRHNKHTIPEPDVKIPIVDRILLALYINLTGQFVLPLSDRQLTCLDSSDFPSSRILRMVEWSFCPS